MSSLKDGPLAGLGQTYGPAFDPIFGTMAPLGKWLGDDQQAWGRPLSLVPLRDGELVSLDATGDPGYAPDAIDWRASFNAIDASSQIVETWRYWELSRLLVDPASVLVLEQIATSIDSIDALDDDGFPMFSYGPQNGARPTAGSVTHPTPAPGFFSFSRLEWQFRLTTINMGSNGQTPPLAVAAQEQQGRDLVDPWGNCSQGSDLVWGSHMQRVIPGEMLVRLFVGLRAPSGLFRARIGGRIAGFSQSASSSARALASVTTRSA